MNLIGQEGQMFAWKLLMGLLLAIVLGQQARAGTVSEINREMHLSQWLNELPLSTNAYLPGLVWMVPQEQVVQLSVKRALLDQLRTASYGVSRRDAQHLADFVASLPATGRVVVPRTNARWLQVNPLFDPWLKKGQHIVIPTRPDYVTVVKGDGSTCRVAHSVRLYARDYARRCDAADHAQLAWVVQPDGLVQRVGVATWNETQQNPPAPGAWIVVSDSHIPWPNAIMAQVARLLATQGVAPDPDLKKISLPEPKLRTDLLGLYRQPRNNALTYNDWGMIGLIQTPTARMASAGHAALDVSRVYPYTRLTGSMQIMDWFELGVRWTSISNRLYGPANFSGNQAYKDKSVDFKVKLRDETAWLPGLALGLRDLGGTGLFSGEYLVSSKRTGNFDWSLGLGWGYVGARGNLSNPLSVLSSKFSARPVNNVGHGGTVSSSIMFRGRTALFGGVQYQTPWKPLLLKLEYEGNNYQHEPSGNNQRQRSPFNVGLVYRWNPGVDLALNLERGNTLAMNFSFHGDLSKFTLPKLNDPKPEPISAIYPDKEPDWTKVAAKLEEKTSWRVLQIKRAGSEVIVRFQGADAQNWNGYVDRIASVLHRYVPNKNILLFRIQSDEYGLGMHEFVIDRHAWVEAKTSYIPTYHKQKTVFERPAFKGFDYPQVDKLVDRPLERFTGNTGLYLNHSFGGPEGLMYKIGLYASGSWHFKADTWWTGTLQSGLIDNYNKFIYPASNSTLPRVRTNIERYVNSSPVNMPLFQLTHVGKFNNENFYSVYGGMLESMYGGVGGEWLYRPWQSPVAFGVDLNAVQQRGFAQDFTFLPYKTLTGHASLYWQTGFQHVNATVHVGKYLAGDVGATLDLSRTFVNGVKMGAYATKTNVSAAQFGEGSFNKGVYVNIPFNALLTRSSTNFATIRWQPLTRDGGAMLNRAFRLFDLTKDQGGNLLDVHPWSNIRKTQFGEVPDTFVGFSYHDSLFTKAKNDLANVGKLSLTPQFWKSMMWMGGVTLASSIMDKRLNNTAINYGARPAMKAVESIGNMLPILALGASGVAYFGGNAESKLSKTAYSSLAAGGVGLAGAMALKYVLGRDRPRVGKGSSSFHFLNKNNANASMPSGHTTIIWAAITPYAKAYDAPWLYGLAALTNIARVGGRNHWFSDTVAGSLLGYAIGDFIYQTHENSNRHGMQWRLSPNGVSAYWKLD
ncbi:MAG: YjbH domain-containing protein [Gallionella sp.]